MEFITMEQLEKHCKDKQQVCRDLEVERRKASVPSVRWTVATMMAGTIGVCLSIFMYVQNNAITSYDRDARERFATRQEHKEDVASINRKIETLIEVQVDVSKKLDRNLAVIERIGKR